MTLYICVSIYSIILQHLIQQRLTSYTIQVWAIPRPLVATKGISLRFLFLAVLRYFNSRSIGLYDILIYKIGYPIRISTAIAGIGTLPWLFAANHVLHPFSTQGIHLQLLKRLLIFVNAIYFAVNYHVFPERKVTFFIR